MSPKLKKFLVNSVFLPITGFGICLLGWAAFSMWSFDKTQNKNAIPSPVKTVVETTKYIAHPFTDNKSDGYRGVGLELWDSLKLVGLGYFAALIVAVPIGFLLGGSETFKHCFDPIFQILRPVSPLAWFPLSMQVVLTIKNRMSLGIDVTEWQCIFTIAICSVWPTILNTAVGVRAIPQDYLNVARVLKLGVMKRFFSIQLPATMPYMFTGFRLSLGISWLVIVAVEMLAGKPGIGNFLWNSYNNGNYEAMIMSIFFIGLVGFALDRLMSLFEKNADTMLALMHRGLSTIRSLIAARIPAPSLPSVDPAPVATHSTSISGSGS